MFDQADLLLMLPPHQQPANLPQHWKEAQLEAKLYPGQAVPQLVINGDPMPHAYVPPIHDRWQFKPGAGGNSIWEHLPRLADLAAAAAVIVEVGIASMTGSTHAFDLGLAASDKPTRHKFHIGVDIHESVSGPWVPTTPYWRFVSGDSRSPATVQKVQDILSWHMDGDGLQRIPIDILYIDTVHEYGFLKAELRNWLPLIGPNTLVLFHDTHHQGQYHPLTNAIMEMVANTADTLGPLAYTHEYIQISERCEGLGALSPLNGWPR